MSAALALSPTDKLTGAKAFARSLNILLKHVRLYGLAHKRSTDQFDQAWTLLQSVLTGDNGFLLGISGDKLLLDGVPLESGPAEQSFAKMLAASGIASIHFSNSVTANDLQSIVTTFANSRPSELLANLQSIAQHSPTQGVKVNEVRFVPHDSVHDDAAVPMASLITANTINELGPQVTDWIKDPKKLLQLISAAEGTKGGHDDGTGNGNGELQAEIVPAYENHPAPLEEDEVISVIRFMTRMGTLKQHCESAPDSATMQHELSELTPSAHSALYQMLFNTVANSFDGQDSPDLLKLAEHLAIRFAVESFERGEVKINAVQQMIERLNKELESLRSVLHSHEDQMSRAGLLVESQSEILDRQFWASVPDWGKKNVLLSEDSWCIPARNVRSYVEQLIERRDGDTAISILANFTSGVESTDMEARRKVATGLTELAELCGRVDHGLLQQCILRVGRQLAAEQSLEIQTLLSAAFVRLSQEASAKRDYPALEQSMCSLARVEKSQPNLVRDMRPRISVQSRLHDFVAEVHQGETLPKGLVDVLRRTPGPAAEEIASQFARCSTLQETERYLDLLNQIGSPAIEHLRELLLQGPAAEGIIGIGVLTRLDIELMLNELPKRACEWSRLQQDSVVRQIASSGAELRGELLLSLLEHLDPLIIPEAIDEIGLSGNSTTVISLLDLASGEGAAASSQFAQLKAVEAVGRLRINDAEDMLAEIIQQRSLIGFSNARELRLAAMQALQNINPERAKRLLVKSGLDEQELNIRPLDATDTNWLRQRRYERVVPNTTINATAITAKGRCPVALERISLGGGLAVRNGRGQFGSEALLEMQLGMRHLRSRVLIREANAGVMFEIADIGMDERNRLRKLIAAQMR
ncbi:MAG TPA: hypothetical protein VN577_18055 [Terriglobales bacterium]|nr:hypothetical protein [Terriglobales bacterium]